MSLKKNTGKTASSAPVPSTVAVPPESVKAPTSSISRKELAMAIREIVSKTNLAISTKVAETVVVAYEEAIIQALKAGEEVSLPGFGKFLSVHKDVAEKRNPSNGETVIIAAHNVPRFKAGSKFKSALGGGVDSPEE